MQILWDFRCNPLRGRAAAQTQTRGIAEGNSPAYNQAARFCFVKL
jgi:hypothetical protein